MTVHFCWDKLKACECGCGTTIRAFDKWHHYPRRFKHGHGVSTKGKHWKLSEETKKKQGLAKLGDKNPQWKGDSPSFTALHTYVKHRLPKPEFCEMCNNNRAYDLANITGTYSRDLKNWKYYCRKCHMLSDGRMKNLKQFRGDD